MQKVGVHFGALSDSLENQLKEQNLKDKWCKRHQNDIDAIVMLCMHDMVTDSQARSIREKIVKDVQRNVEVIKSE